MLLHCQLYMNTTGKMDCNGQVFSVLQILIFGMKGASDAQTNTVDRTSSAVNRVENKINIIINVQQKHYLNTEGRSAPLEKSLFRNFLFNMLQNHFQTVIVCLIFDVMLYNINETFCPVQCGHILYHLQDLGRKRSDASTFQM